MNVINKSLYEYVDEIDDNFNPFEDMKDLDDDKIKKEIEEKEEVLHKLIERSMFLWLYPNYKMPISKVKELVQPYFEDEKKAEWLGEKVGQFLQECVNLRETYNEEQKNLKALANKKKN